MILANQAPSGAYPAGPDFPVYRYSWFRDGAFIADAMSRSGHIESAEAFFAWCTRVIGERSSRIEGLLARHAAGDVVARSELLHARYTVDGRESPEEWWNFQLDGYGTWLWALGAHVARHNRPLGPYLPGVEPTVRYLLTFHGLPSYDWWEESPDHRHTSTLGALFAGLTAAAGWHELGADLRADATTTADAIRALILADARRAGHLVKWLEGDALDASLVACISPFGVVAPHDPLAVRTVELLERGLAHGGVHRYAADTFYGGGEWPLLAGFLGWTYAASGRIGDAFAELEWIATHATPAGELAEQVADHLLAPDRRAEWIARWGPVATPLLWSHAMYLTLALRLGVIEAPVSPEPQVPGGGTAAQSYESEVAVP